MSWDDDLDEGDDEDTTAPCPHCGADVYDDAERCPHCGVYLSAEDTPRRPKPLWVVVGALAALVGMLWWVLQL